MDIPHADFDRLRVNLSTLLKVVIKSLLGSLVQHGHNKISPKKEIIFFLEYY